MTSRLLLILLCLWSLPARAWGPDIHALIADMAEAHLTPTARSQMHILLDLEDRHYLSGVAAWADYIRRDAPETAHWHYVDIPLDQTHFNALRDCPGDDCITAQLARFAQRLGNPSLSPTERLEALKWITHLAADLHQPLHTADHDDKGGNLVNVSYFGRSTNFHAIWDSTIIHIAMDLHPGPGGGHDHRQILQAARDLDADISPAQRLQWSQGVSLSTLPALTIAWAEESHLQAQAAYAGPVGDSSAYQAMAWPIARIQVQRASVRLAAVLNVALK